MNHHSSSFTMNNGYWSPWITMIFTSDKYLPIYSWSSLPNVELITLNIILIRPQNRAPHLSGTEHLHVRPGMTWGRNAEGVPSKNRTAILPRSKIQQQFVPKFDQPKIAYWCVLRRVAGWVARGGMMTLLVMTGIIHSRKFPAFSTSKIGMKMKPHKTEHGKLWINRFVRNSAAKPSPDIQLSPIHGSLKFPIICDNQLIFRSLIGRLFLCNQSYVKFPIW